MDPTEDLSARVLLKHILSTEPPKTPITRSVTKAQSLSATRRSSRLRSKDAVGQTPQDILRRSLRQKMHESITRKALPSTKRRTAMQRESNTTAVLMPFDDGDTPRHILKNILMTEPVKSPVVHKKAETEEPKPSSANSSLTGKHTSIELSGLDLPDVTMSTAPTIMKGLSRKRLRQSLNVTAFEKRLKGEDDVGEESELSANEYSSLSLSRSTSLSLKTPFADAWTEKRGLQRRVSNRRKITEEEFGAAVNKIEMGGASSFVGLGPSDATYTEGFTLGLSKVSEPDITTDIVHCDVDHDAQSEEESRTRSQYKEGETAQDSQTEDSDPQDGVDVSARSQFVGQEKEETAQDSPADECGGESQPRVNVSTGSQSQEEEKVEIEDSHDEEQHGGDSQPEMDVSTGSQTQEEEEETAQDSHSEEQYSGDPQPEMDVSTGSQSQEEEEETAQDSHDEEQHGGDSQPEMDVSTGSQSQEEEEETAQDSPADECGGESQPRVNVSTGSQSQEEEEETAKDSHDEEQHGGDPQAGVDVSARYTAVEEEEEETAQYSQNVNSQTKELSAVDCQSDEEEHFADERDHKNSTEEDFTHSQADDEEIEEDGDGCISEEQDENISRRAYCSGGDVIQAAETGGDTSEMGCSKGESKANGTFILPNNLEVGDNETDQPHKDLAELSTTRQPDMEDPEDLADKENCSGDSQHLGSDSPAEDAAEDGADLENESEDDEEVPSKTPVFAREKSIPFAENVQPSGTSKSSPAKAKQIKKTSRPGKREGGLPKSYLMNVFKHFAKTKVSAQVYPVLKEVMDKFFGRLTEDLETYALHAKRKTIEVEDAKLLLKRQGYVNDKVPVEVLIEKYLRLDQRKLLIPIATSGNVVVPKKR